MSYYLSQLEGPQRRAECAKHDAADRELDARLLHRIPAPSQSELNRRASCAALGLDPDAPLAFISSPMVRFAALVVGIWSAVVAVIWWGAA